MIVDWSKFVWANPSPVCSAQNHAHGPHEILLPTLQRLHCPGLGPVPRSTHHPERLEPAPVNPESHLRFEVAPPEREIPEDLRKAYDDARAAVYGGCTWDGNPENVQGLTMEEALSVVQVFLAKFDTWLKSPEDR